jgi:tRNA dimethylallyltransferase
MNKTLNKLVVILGPTATGKTKMAVRLAYKHDGEIVSADSRQVYKGMDIGTGKDLSDYKYKDKPIPYHLIDVVSPKTDFNVAKYQKQAFKAIDDIIKRGKTPFLVGGTGLYIDAVINNYVFSEVGKSKLVEIRKKLDKQSLSSLLSKLKKIDPKTYQTIDKQNKRRVQRAIEIYLQTGQTKSDQPKNKRPRYKPLIVGIKFPLEKIYQKIDKRLDNRLHEGMVQEVKTLRKAGVSWKRLDSFGLEYRWISKYLRGSITELEMVELLKNDIHHFAKRQLTWFKRNKKIIWTDKLSGADGLIKNFIAKD